MRQIKLVLNNAYKAKQLTSNIPKYIKYLSFLFIRISSYKLEKEIKSILKTICPFMNSKFFKKNFLILLFFIESMSDVLRSCFVYKFIYECKAGCIGIISNSFKFKCTNTWALVMILVNN